jgi:hypothetical protein
LDPSKEAAPPPVSSEEDGEPPVTVRATSGNLVPAEDVDHNALPALLPDNAVMPWLHRRLHLTTRAAQRVRLAAQGLRDAAG